MWQSKDFYIFYLFGALFLLFAISISNEPVGIPWPRQLCYTEICFEALTLQAHNIFRTSVKRIIVFPAFEKSLSSHHS